MPIDVDTMLDNMACASQDVQILEERSTRGAVLRSIVQWMESHELYDPQYHEAFVRDLKMSVDYDS